MEKIGNEPAAKFINALIKSVQTLCHGYLEFNTGIEIVGHINLSVDKGSLFHYIVEEKVCKNEENSTLFISNSFFAESQTKKGESKTNEKSVTNRISVTNDAHTPMSMEQHVYFGDELSAISSISEELSNANERVKSGWPESNATYCKSLNTSKRRAPSDDFCGYPAKTMNISSEYGNSADIASPLSPIDIKPTICDADGEIDLAKGNKNEDEYTGQIGVGLPSCVLESVTNQESSEISGKGENSDSDLEVTFIKEEYMDDSNSFQLNNELLPEYSCCTNDEDSISTQNLPICSASTSTYFLDESNATAISNNCVSMSTSSQASHFDSKGVIFPLSHDRPPTDSKMLKAYEIFKVNTNDLFQVSPAIRPSCGYVEQADVEMWKMHELMPGSGVYIHQENFQDVMSKSCNGYLVGKAIARYLMSCFWKSCELDEASIAEQPRSHHHSLDKGIINAILDCSEKISGEPRSAIRQAMWNKISAATSYARQCARVQVAETPCSIFKKAFL